MKNFPIRNLFPLARICVGLVGGFVGCSTVHAQAVVSWSTASLISGDSDVMTTGTTVWAMNVGPGGVTSAIVNGVTFAAFPFPANGITNQVVNGSLTFTESPGVLLSFGDFGFAAPPFSGLSAGYQSLLSSAGTANTPGTLVLSLGGLIAGHEYLFQWWSNSSFLSSYPAGVFNTQASDGFAHTLTLSSGAGSDGTTGRYGTGTFTAVGTMQDIMFDGLSGGLPLINAFQVRDVTAVPELSTCAGLAGVAAMGFAFRRRRRTN